MLKPAKKPFFFLSRPGLVNLRPNWDYHAFTEKRMNPSESSSTTPTENSESQSIWQEIVSFVKTLSTILILALVIRTLIIEPFKIPSASMRPTLEIGDYILVLKYSYGLRIPFVAESAYQWSAPKRGDVVVFTRPDDPATPTEDDSAINIIKRVIGLPGETVEVRGTQVFIDDKPLSEPYARWSDGGILEGNFGPATIPAGKIFLMGDNRDHSKDSRFWTDHFLDISRVKGRAVIIFWSFDSLSRIGNLIR